VLVEALVLAQDQRGAQGGRDVGQPDPLAAPHQGVGAQAFQLFAVAIEQQRIGRLEPGAHLVERGHGVRRPAGEGDGQDERSLHFAASTFIRALGSSPNISGAYIASTRVGGRAKSPTLFRRTVYSTLKVPLGTYS